MYQFCGSIKLLKFGFMIRQKSRDFDRRVVLAVARLVLIDSGATATANQTWQLPSSVMDFFSKLFRLRPRNRGGIGFTNALILN